MLNLNVTIDPHSGFCFGVVYAIEMAEDMLEKNGYLYCLGDIVHNDEEVKRLQKKGLITIDHEEFNKLKNEYVLIRAHGEPPETYRKAIENNITLIDATCPVVLKLQNRIKKSYDNDENILIYGKEGHAEVKGLIGQLNNKGKVFADIQELNENELPEKVTLYTQTTKSKIKFREITNTLRERGIAVEAHDTTCTQVSDRENTLRKFVSAYDRIVFVAGKQSSNGKVLYQVCREVNPNTTFVSHPDEIDYTNFLPHEKIGICGATSTPLWLMKDVKARLEHL